MSNSTVSSGNVRDALTALNNRNSPLLSLPGELRNIIYAYLFGSTIYKSRATYNIFFQDDKFEEEREDKPFLLSNDVAILHACRQTHAEAHHLLYELSTFDCERLDELPFFIFETKSVTRQKIQHVNFTSDSDYNHVDQFEGEGYVFSEMLPGVRSVFVNFVTHWYDEKGTLSSKRLEVLRRISQWMSDGHEGRIQFDHSSLSG